jgi:hypothetical protein|eukprot:SAG25_NODE_1171_length_3701_cov_2.201277_5_plen_89_part_00
MWYARLRTRAGGVQWFGLPYSDDMGCVDTVWPNLPIQPLCLKDDQPGVNRTSHEKWPLPLYHSTSPNCSGQGAQQHVIMYLGRGDRYW